MSHKQSPMKNFPEVEINICNNIEQKIINFDEESKDFGNFIGIEKYVT